LLYKSILKSDATKRLDLLSFPLPRLLRPLFTSIKTVELSLSIRIYEKGNENVVEIQTKVSRHICRGGCIILELDGVWSQHCADPSENLM